MKRVILYFKFFPYQLLVLQDLCLYNRREFREKIKEKFGSWLFGIEKMQRRIDDTKEDDTKEIERRKLWEKFDADYGEVISLVDSEVRRYI